MIFVLFPIKLRFFEYKFFIEQRRLLKHISDGGYMYDKISCLRTYFHNFWRCYKRDQYTRSRYSILTAHQWEEVREHTLLQVEQYRIKREEERDQYTRRRYSILTAQQMLEVREHTLLKVEQRYQYTRSRYRTHTFFEKEMIFHVLLFPRMQKEDTEKIDDPVEKRRRYFEVIHLSIIRNQWSHLS